MKRKLFIIVLIISAAFVFNAPFILAADMTANDLVAEAKKGIVEISLTEGKALFDKGGVIFLDCRGVKEYKSGHIPGAINIPRGLLEFKIGKKISDKNASIVIYCKAGGRAVLGCCNLVRMGYKNIKSMAGGWRGWQKTGYPAEK